MLYKASTHICFSEFDYNAVNVFIHIQYNFIQI
jgi:hypothetical protein